MKKLKSYLGCLTLILSLYTEGVAQNITSNNGAKMVISSGSFVVVPSNVSNSGANTAIVNKGTLITEGSVQNTTTATISGNGSSKVGGNWENAATFTAATSTVELTGNAAATVNSGNSNFYNLALNKGASNPIVNLLTNSARVTNSLNFTGANNKIQLGILNLAVGLPIVGAASTKYIISDGVGRLIASTVGSTAFVFPIGSSSTSYTPLSISQTGTPLSLGARVQNQVLSNGATGIALTNGVVNKTWVVTEESTAERNIAHFDIEKSVDSKLFLKIARRDAINRVSSTTPSVYQAIDDLFFNSSYYRLKINELDGSSTYSEILYLEKNSDKTLKIIRDTEGSVLIETNDKIELITVTNSIGQLIKSTKEKRFLIVTI